MTGSSAPASPESLLRSGANSPDLFTSVFGSVRGYGMPAELLKAGHAGEAELSRLCILLDQGSYDEVAWELQLHSDELAPELARPHAAVEDVNEVVFWHLWSDLWTVVRRIQRQPANRVERLLARYVRGCASSRLPDSPQTDHALSALGFFGAVPHLLNPDDAHGALESAAMALALRANLHSLLVSDEIASQQAAGAPNREYEAWGAIMAEWTLAAGPELVLSHALSPPGWRELNEYLEGLNGLPTSDWLSTHYMPFSNWQDFYSNCLYATGFTNDKFKGGITRWGPLARRELQEWLLGLPDTING